MESKMKDPMNKTEMREDMLDEALNAMHELYMLKEYIEERLTLHREQISTYVDDKYDETVIARYDELAKIKFLKYY